MAQAIPSHPSAEQLSHFGLGRLPDAEAEAVARHLEQCPACSAAAQRVAPDSFVGRVRKAGPVTTGTPAPPGTLSPSVVARQAGKVVAPPKDVPAELVNHPKYQVMRELGRGGMGVVYQARQTVMNRQVVIKVINRALLNRPESLERFHREVQAAAQLSHPNIVTAYDAEQAGELHMLVMEFVPGQSLAEVLEKKGPLPVAHACHYMRQVALGLQHAHERGMVHRDIKPGNIMLMPKNQVKILDFGLAKMVSERRLGKALTASDSYMGTPDYSAPEQATDARTADIRADLYSLGCTLYCLLAGRPPFEEDTPVKTILAHLEKQPRPLPELRPDVPAALWQVVSRLLAKNPAQRYQKPVEVAQALLPFIKLGAQAEVPGKPASLAAKGSAGKATAIAANTGEIRAVLRAMPVKTPAGKAPGGVESESPFAGLADATVLPRKGVTPPNAAKPAIKAWYQRWQILTGAGSVLLLLAFAGLWAAGVFGVKVKTADGTIVLDGLPDGAEVTVDGKIVYVKTTSDDKPVEIRAIPGRRLLEVKKAGIRLETREVTLTDGERKPIRIALVAFPGPTPESKQEEKPGATAGKSGTRPDPLRRKVSLQRPYPQAYAGAPIDKITVQHAAKELLRQAELEYDFEGSKANVGELASRWVTPTIIDEACDAALQQLLSPVGLAYEVEGNKVALELAGRTAGAKSAGVEGNAYTPMFNGRDLTGWKKVGSETTSWTWEDDALVARNTGNPGQAAFLVTKRTDYADFHFRAEVQAWLGPHISLAFRVSPTDENPGGLPGYAVHIPGASHEQDTATHAIGTLGTAARLKPFLAIAEARPVVFPRGSRFLLEVVARGSHFQVFVDRKCVVDYVDKARRFSRGGFWLLCRPGNTVLFRKVEIKELSSSQTEHQGQTIPAAVTNSIGMKLVRVPHGSFWMGDRSQKRRVEVPNDFFLGAFLITHEQWRTIMGNDPSWWSRGGGGAGDVRGVSDADLQQFPVEQVSWDEVQDFLRHLNAHEKGRGLVYRLPTETEWEYACRGAPTSEEESAFEYYLSEPTNDLSSNHANFNGNFPGGNAPKGPVVGRATKVGSYPPNRLGLYDMHGNLWEWCEARVLRGGCWYDGAGNCRASCRYVEGQGPQRRSSYVGVRIAAVPSGKIEANETTHVENGFVPLFNGTSLAGWKERHSGTIIWTAIDGMLVGKNTGGPGMGGSLRTNRSDYRDFDLRCEAMLGEGLNSAIVIRGANRDTLQNGARAEYAVQIASADKSCTDGGTTGSLQINHQNTPSDVLAPATESKLIPGKWFKIEIIAVGWRIRVLIDGHVVLDYDDRGKTFSEGQIGFGCRPGSTVRFRNITIKELPLT